MNAIKCFFGIHSLKIIDQHTRIFTQNSKHGQLNEYPITTYVLQCQYCGIIQHKDIKGTFRGE